MRNSTIKFPLLFLPPNPLKGALRKYVSYIKADDNLLIHLYYESYERKQSFKRYQNEVFIYLEKIFEQTQSKTITVLEPPLGGRG
jgi:hypothetical protein